MHSTKRTYKPKIPKIDTCNSKPIVKNRLDASNKLNDLLNFNTNKLSNSSQKKFNRFSTLYNNINNHSHNDLINCPVCNNQFNKTNTNDIINDNTCSKYHAHSIVSSINTVWNMYIKPITNN